MDRIQLLKRVLLVLLGFAVIYILMIVALRAIGLTNAQQFIYRSAGWAPAIFVALCALSLVLAPLSGSSLFILGGTLFGREQGFFLSLLASVLGCSMNFWISKQFGRPVVLHLLGKRNFKALNKFTRQLKGERGVVYLTLIMPLSQDVVSYAAGLTAISYSRFLVALILSGLVVVTGYVYLGSSLLEALL